MPQIKPVDYPLVTGSWTCSECGKDKLRKAYACEVCYAVLCEDCVDGEHEQPTSEHGQVCGESRSVLDEFEQVESD